MKKRKFLFVLSLSALLFSCGAKEIVPGSIEINKDVIENLNSLFRYIINNNNPKLKWWAELYSKVPTEQIINYLKIKYADK